MNMISSLRRRVSRDGSATLKTEEYNQLQAEWIKRVPKEALRDAFIAGVKLGKQETFLGFESWYENLNQ